MALLLFRARPRFSRCPRQPGRRRRSLGEGRATRILAFLASVAGLSLADPASAGVITFDDLPDTSLYNHIPNPYAGFDWSPHFLYLDGADYPYPSGYQTGVVSGPNVAFNENGLPANFSRRMPFELDSFYLTAAWRDGLEVTVTGYLNDKMVDSKTLTVSTSGPTRETFNNWDVNKVVFRSFGGTPVGFTGYQFVLDNVRISPVPEPSARFNSFSAVPESSTWALMLLGFAGLGFTAYNRSKRHRLALLTPFDFGQVLRKQKSPASMRNERGANGARRAESASNAPDLDIVSRRQACQSPI
jgi:hypothetical protein